MAMLLIPLNGRESPNQIYIFHLTTKYHFCKILSECFDPMNHKSPQSKTVFVNCHFCTFYTITETVNKTLVFVQEVILRIAVLKCILDGILNIDIGFLWHLFRHFWQVLTLAIIFVKYLLRSSAALSGGTSVAASRQCSSE